MPSLSKKRTYRDISLVHSSLWWPWHLLTALEDLGSFPETWVRTLGLCCSQSPVLEYLVGISKTRRLFIHLQSTTGPFAFFKEQKLLCEYINPRGLFWVFLWKAPPLSARKKAESSSGHPPSAPRSWVAGVMPSWMPRRAQQDVSQDPEMLSQFPG